jgi:tRNA G18 (ribose-2'-O)-methylase SpoU
VKIVPARGYFEIGIYQGKTVMNLGTLWRSAYQLGAAGIFTIGQRMPPQASDTLKAYRHIPLRRFATFDEFMAGRPHDCPLVGVEMEGKPLAGYAHPQRAQYLLGAEDIGLPRRVREQCQAIITIESLRTESYNVAVAGSLVMWHRVAYRTEAWGSP